MNNGDYKLNIKDLLLIMLIIILAIVFFPVSITMFILSETKINRDYKFLKIAGFKSKRNKALGIYYWIKHNICIKYLHDHRNQVYEYSISLTYDQKTPVFKSLYDWQTGTEQEREALKNSILRYANASSLELQMDEPDREVEIRHRDFIKLHLEEILRGGILHKMEGQETTDIPIFYIAKRFYPTKEYVEFSLITDRSEIVTYDGCLCKHISQMFYDEPQKQLEKDQQIIAVFKNPIKKNVRIIDKGFQFCGYDLSEEMTTISAITNCGELFEHSIDISDLNEYGLFSSLDKAVEMRQLLEEKFPEEPHAGCEIYEIWRKI